MLSQSANNGFPKSVSSYNSNSSYVFLREHLEVPAFAMNTPESESPEDAPTPSLLKASAREATSSRPPRSKFTDFSCISLDFSLCVVVFLSWIFCIIPYRFYVLNSSNVWPIHMSLCVMSLEHGIVYSQWCNTCRNFTNLKRYYLTQV